jgi:simple sugar transport system substrate-binding protein
MTSISKRSLLKTAALAAIASAVLAGCGQREDPAPAATAPAPTAEPKPVTRAAWVYVGTPGDAGWTFAHDQGRLAAEAHFAGQLQTTAVERVAAGADAERVFRDLAQQGHDIIFGTSFGFMPAMVQVASEFPNVRFEHATGFQLANNLGVYDSSFFQSSYMAGIIAGHKTKTGTLGFVASFPIPEVLRNINAFTLGAQSVRPDITTRVVWVGAWFDPPKESEAAQSLINQGADVLLQNTDSTAVLQTAERNGRFAFGWNSDMSSFAPNAHLASAIVNWTPHYIASIESLRNGTWQSQRVIGGVHNGVNELIKIADVVPAEARTKIENLKAQYRAGTFSPFTGPLVDNQGKEVLAAGQVADRPWLDSMNFYVRGVEGTVPTR